MNYFYYIILFLFIIFSILYIISILNNIIYWVPQVSTFTKDLPILKKVFDKYLIKWKKIVDLWSWIWKMLRIFEKDYKMQSTWFEIDLSNIIIAKIINKIFWYKNIVKKQNYFNADLKEFDFIYLYLFPKLMERLEEKIWKQAKPWTILIVNAFAFKNKKPIEVIQKNWKSKIYVYKI